jgi:hypothetical protein
MSAIVVPCIAMVTEQGSDPVLTGVALAVGTLGLVMAAVGWLSGAGGRRGGRHE